MSETYEEARLATSPDLSAIEQLIDAASSEAADKRGGPLLIDREVTTIPDMIRRHLSEDQAAQSDLDVIVGEFDGSVLGVAAVVYTALASEAMLARLLLFVVDPEARGVGIGAVMMEEVRIRARARGCVSLDAYALPGDRNTKNFFESFGMKARLLTVNSEL